MTSQLRLPTAVAGIDPATACAEIDLAAFRTNVATSPHAGVPAMVVVKADGYGHGMLECAREARVAGAAWLGVATPAEALMLREAGDIGPLLAWLYGVEEDLAPLVAADVDVSAQSIEQIGRLAAAAATAERRARVHLKIDTGLSRNGAPSYDWQHVCEAAAEAEHAGALEVVGIWSHLAAADEPGHPSIPVQLEAFPARVRASQGGRARADLPASGQLGWGPGGTRVAVGSGADRHCRVRHRPGSRYRGACRGRLATRHAAALPAGQCEADPGGRRRLVRMDLDR